MQRKSFSFVQEGNFYFCVLKIFDTISRLLKRKKQPQPLITHHQDVEILRQLKKRKVPQVSQIRHAGRVLNRFEKKTLQFSITGIIVALLWLGGGWLWQHRTPVPAVGGKYVEGMVGSLQFVNPLFSSLNDVDSDLVRLIYSGLMRYDENGILVPDLAERYTLSDDKKTYTFFLRKDVTWQDSTQNAFTAEDVKFTFDLIQDRNVGSPLYVSFEGVDVKVVDDYTVQFTLRQPFSLFLSSLVVGILPEHIWSEIPVNQLRLARNNIQPIGTGPYAFKKLSKNESGYIDKYELKRFERFYRGPAFIEDFVFAFYPAYDSEVGAVEALRSQKIDGLGFVPADLQEKVNKKSIVLYNLSLPQYTALFFNLENSEWREKKEVRDALAMAIDRSRIIQESLKNDGQTIEGPIPDHFNLVESTSGTPFSPDQANQILDKSFKRIEAAEYRASRHDQLVKEFQVAETTTSTSATTTDDTVDIETQVNQALNKELSSTQTFYRQDREKKILEIDLVTADTEEYRHTAELIVGFWQELGIKVNVSAINPKTIERDALRDRKYDVLLYGVILGDNPDPYPFWHSSQMKYPGVNLSQYSNRVVDGLIEKIRSSSNDAEIKKNYQEFNKTLLNDRPAIFLYAPVYRYMVGDDIKGISLKQIYHPSDRFTDVNSWYLKTKGSWKFWSKS